MSEPATELADPGQLTEWRDGDPALLLAAAEAAVRTYCGWHIAPTRTDTFVVNGTGATVLPLPTMHLTAVDSLTEDGAEVEVANVQWSAAGYLYRPAPWTTRLRGVSAQVQHGYADVPLEVQAVVLSVAARGAATPDGAVRQQVGSVSLSFTGAGGVALLEHEQAVLDRYRLP